MKRSFILVWVVVTCLSLFAEGTPKRSHRCIDYEHAMNQTQGGFDWSINFVPDWFDHIEEADDKSGYSKEFLQEHGGRAGTLIVQSLEGNCFYENDENDDININCYAVKCSGTLIGNQYFITAGHCAQAEQLSKNVGVLFGYQKADLEDNDSNRYDDDDEIGDDDNNTLQYPRVSLTGYLDDNGEYIQYEDSKSEYLNFKKHPAYFPILYAEIHKYNTLHYHWNNLPPTV